MQTRFGSCGLVALLLVLACSGSAPEYRPPPDARPLLPDAEPACPPLDTDGDGILDRDEAGNVDTDNDGMPDAMDTDADGDGYSDTAEAGDDDPCSEPVDTDGDNIPDAFDTDSDGNGISDANELDQDLDTDETPDRLDQDDDGDNIDDTVEIGPDATTPRDTDSDGMADFRDIDSDGDGLSDRLEGSVDTDNDNLEDYIDTDADGDGISDMIEAGDNPQSPIDHDSDGFYDFQDADSDNDGLPDEEEDRNGNGVLDSEESNPRSDDTDEDGFLDLVEWAAGTDPNNPLSGLAEDDFYFVLPFLGNEATDDLEFSTTIVKADIFFNVDTTASMSGVINALSTSLQSEIVPQIGDLAIDVAMGVGSFRDFPVGGFGAVTDLPFVLTQRVTTDIDSVQIGINSLFAAGGGDNPEAALEAIYQICTGEGVDWPPNVPGSELPKFDPFVGYNPNRGHGLLGGVGFREGSLPIIVHATDAPYQNVSVYHQNSIPDAHTRDQAIAAARAAGARVIPIIGPFVANTTEYRNNIRQIAYDTGAVVAPVAWGPTQSQCLTGLDGNPETPDPDGLCPLVFSMGFSGEGVAEQVVAGVDALVRFAALDISGIAAGDPLSEINTARFITAITALPPAPQGTSIDGDVFRNVRPGQPVRFRVHARNVVVPAIREAQIFRVTIRVMGSNVTILDTRDVYVIVPGETFEQ